MRLISYKHNGEDKIGHLINSDFLVDISSPFSINNMINFIIGEKYKDDEIISYVNSNNYTPINISDVNITVPIKPRSLRDAYAFRQHVETSRRNRGLDMIGTVIFTSNILIGV